MLAILYKWHLRLGIIAGVLMIVWAASGLIHPLLSFTGIKPMAFTPPVEAVVVEGAKAVVFGGIVDDKRLLTAFGDHHAKAFEFCIPVKLFLGRRWRLYSVNKLAGDFLDGHRRLIVCVKKRWIPLL